MYRSLALAAAALSAHVATAEAQSVYVAPGGVYAPASHIYVKPGAYGTYGVPDPTYAPSVYGPAPFVTSDPVYVEPGPVYGAPGYAGNVYAPPRVYVEPEPAYFARERTVVAPLSYAQEIAPRPPVAVPYGRGRCVVAHSYGRRVYCD